MGDRYEPRPRFRRNRFAGLNQSRQGFQGRLLIRTQDLRSGVTSPGPPSCRQHSEDNDKHEKSRRLRYGRPGCDLFLFQRQRQLIQGLGCAAKPMPPHPHQLVLEILDQDVTELQLTRQSRNHILQSGRIIGQCLGVIQHLHRAAVSCVPYPPSVSVHRSISVHSGWWSEPWAALSIVAPRTRPARAVDTKQ